MATTSGEDASIEDYIIGEKLGSGSYATVYKAYRKGRHRELVAVKCIERSSLNKTSTENLLTEIELLKTLHHENIVELKDFHWDKKRIYLIMEYCSGGDLSQFIRSKRTLTEKTARHFLRQLALALGYMRTKHVSHMDLKPGNILLSSSGVLKVADFGFAHYLHGDTDAEHLRGSPLYMAPEIITRRHYNEKADLWSTGVILYECIFGRAPFQSGTISQLEQKIIDTKPIELPQNVSISPECRDLIQRLLRRDPSDRMSFDEFLSHPFLDLAHSPPSALERAATLIQEAVELDTAHDYKKALLKYNQALTFFMPAIEYEMDPEKKEVIRSKVQEYMKRTEQIKAVLRPCSAASAVKNSAMEENMCSNDQAAFQRLNSTSSVESHTVESSPAPTFEELWEDNDEILDASKQISIGRIKEKASDFKGALKNYELALESMLPILKDEPKGRRRKALQKVVLDLMSWAETLKKYIEMREEHVEMEEGPVAEEADFFSMSNCVIS